MISAKEVKQVADKVNDASKEAQEILLDIEKQIKNAAENGSYLLNLEVAYKHHNVRQLISIISKTLVDSGFRCNINPEYDPRNPKIEIDIGWND